MNALTPAKTREAATLASAFPTASPLRKEGEDELMAQDPSPSAEEGDFNRTDRQPPQ